MKTERKIGPICVCFIVIIFQVLRLLTWYLPYPHDIQLILFMYTEPWLTLFNFSNVGSIVLAIWFIAIIIKENGKEQ